MPAVNPTDPIGSPWRDATTGGSAIGGVFVVLALGIAGVLVMILLSPWL